MGPGFYYSIFPNLLTDIMNIPYPPHIGWKRAILFMAILMPKTCHFIYFRVGSAILDHAWVSRCEILLSRDQADLNIFEGVNLTVNFMTNCRFRVYFVYNCQLITLDFIFMRIFIVGGTFKLLFC
jgi:hypothetical protein